MSWDGFNNSIIANRQKDTFVHGFIDVSGHTIIRNGDLSLNQGRLFVNRDASFNGNISIGKDVTILGRLNVKNFTNQNIINTTTNNYQLIVSEDLSLNGRLFVSGNVGIGTTNPTCALEILTSSTSSDLHTAGVLKVQNKSVAANRTSNILVTVGDGIANTGSTNTAFYSTDIVGRYGFSHGMVGDSSRYSFKTNYNFTGTEVLTLTSDAKVGIGKSDPAYTLDVNGTFKTSGDSYLSGSNVRLPRVLASGSAVLTNGGNLIDVVNVGTLPTGYTSIVFCVCNGDGNAQPDGIICPIVFGTVCRVKIVNYVINTSIRVNYIAYAI